MPNNSGRKRRFGAVRQLPSGRWQIRYPDPVTKQLRNGDRTYPTKRDAEVKLSEIEADIVRGRWADPDAGRVGFGDFMDRWFRERDYASTTRGRNGGVIRLHIRPHLGELAVGEIDTPRVRRWRAELLEAGVGEATVVKAYQILRAALNTAVDDGLIQRNPCRIKGAGITKSAERPVLTVEEVFAVAGAIEGRYRAMVLLAAFTGMRFGELALCNAETSTWRDASSRCGGPRQNLSRGSWRSRHRRARPGSVPSRSLRRSFRRSRNTCGSSERTAGRDCCSSVRRAAGCVGTTSMTPGRRRSRVPGSRASISTI